MRLVTVRKVGLDVARGKLAREEDWVVVVCRSRDNVAVFVTILVAVEQ